MYFIDQVKKCIDTPVGDFTIRGAVTREPVPFENRKSLDFKEYKIGDSWGVLFSCGWFHLTGKINPAVTEPVYLKLDMNCEALLFDRDGVPEKGFTNGSSNFGFMGMLGTPAKRYFPLKDYTTTEGDVELWIDAGMNDLFGNVKKKGRIETLQMVTRDLKARELYYDLHCLVPLKKAARKRDRHAWRIYRTGLKRAAGIIRRRKEAWIDAALEITRDLLKTPTKADHEVSSIGHAHLDLAWLWPIRETRRKGARTFANALRLMEQYDDFRFGASQPQLYKWVKEQHPALYEQVRRRIAEGRWEVQGGMWVEADTNVSGEEALVRQMLYGIRYYQEEFGIRVDSLWLPDVFGYSGNMPQIIKKSGLDNFMTIKISWNDTNKFPHHTFNWKGIDGSSVFAHMPPEGEYNSPATPGWLLKSMENYREKKIDNRTLNLFGVGDGGGGPSAGHVERIRRLGGRAPLPRVKMESSREFFRRLSADKHRFPSYNGELYLEKHRGTYTSQGRVKYFNRKMEQKLKTLETLLVQTGRYGEFKDEIRTIWQEVLLYQFHDILPGSSIRRVYDECVARYGILDRRTDEIASAVLGSGVLKEGAYAAAGGLTAYNPLPVEAKILHFGIDRAHELKIAPLSGRITASETWEQKAAGNTRLLENRYLKVVLGRDGSIRSVYDREGGRQVLKGRANRFRMYTDVANAWDIFRYYRLLPVRTMKLRKTEAFTYGPVQEIVQHYTCGGSTLIQKIRLNPDSRRIDFDLKVEWKSLRRMLRTAFPLNLQTDRAVFDIQFGHLARSTKNRTKVERAQYEACGQNWADMSSGGWGAALITDSKYGFRAKGSTLDLNLIKSTNHPCKQGDLGSHEMRYALYVHSGDHVEGRVDAAAMEFNTWMPLFRKGEVPAESLFELDSDAVSYSTLKESEDGTDLILRLYERNGRDAACSLRFNRPVKEIHETNMVEETPVKIAAGAGVELTFSPFEVKTLKIMVE